MLNHSYSVSPFSSTRQILLCLVRSSGKKSLLFSSKLPMKWSLSLYCMKINKKFILCLYLIYISFITSGYTK
ncbi:hypothetical protein CLOSTHATH_01080 [Hungatella hathewayi DSM 13479]|uniref:Uncharacterized protein n=1 Tax=Hungatella hathewayi DSM 13479 TaxID=566550 RepID=D3ABV3_9FIRM|nr:hypothetical protein CLOSTHATH_01080 [Hungatella hathewayi DSM 13479]